MSYRLSATTSGQAGLARFNQELERLLDVQEKIKAQGSVITSLQAQVAPALAATRAQAQEEIRLARELAAAKKAAANDYSTFQKRQLTEQEQAEKAAHTAGMQRLRDRAATWRLNARLAADSERQAQEAITQTIRALDREQKSTRDLWQVGKIVGADIVQMQRDVQRRALEAAGAIDKQSDAYRRLTQIAGAAERTTNSALGRNTPGGFSHGVTLGIQNSGLMNYAASFGGPSAQALGIVSTSFLDAKKAALEFGGATNSAATAAGFLSAGVAGAAAGVGLLAVGTVQAAKVAATFESAMDSAKVSTGANAEELTRLNDAALNLGKGLGFGATAAARGIEELGSQGLNAAQVLDGGLIASMTLARATTGDLALASRVSAGALNAWKMDAKDLPGVADTISAAVNNTTLRMDNLADGIAAGGQSAKSFGTDFRQYIAMLSFGTDAMLSASDAGTSLKAMYQALTPNSKEARLAMSELNFSAFDAQGQFKGMETVIRDLTAATASLTPEQRQMKLETIFGADATRIINILIDQGAEGLRKRTDALNRDGEAMRSAKDKMDNAAGATLEWQRATEKLQIAWATGILPVFTKFLNETATPLADKIGDLVKNLNEVKSPGDLKAVLTIGPGDDFTSATLKLLFKGAGFAKDAASSPVGSAVGNVWNPATRAAQVAQWVGGALGAEPAPDLTLNRLPVGPQRGSAALPAEPVIVSGRDLVTLMGMGGRNSGTPYGGKYFGGETHNGEDYFARTGSDLLAPFTGYVQTRWSKTTGHIIEMIDAQGQKLLLGHLDRYAAGLEEAITAAGGKLLVQQGQVLGAVGQTGSKAHKDLGPGNAHVHVMAYLPDGTIVDPKTVKFVPLSDAGAATRVKGTYPSAPGSAGVAKTFEQYVAEAKRLTDQLAKYRPDGAAPDADKWRKASAQLQAFTKDNDIAARALEWVQLNVKKSGAEVGKYGETFDRLKGRLDITESLGRLGQDVAPQLQAIQTSAQQAATAEKARNGETEKYRQLLGLAGDAAARLKTIRDGESAELKRGREEADRAAQEQAQHAQQAAQLTKTLNQQLAAGELSQAQATTGKLAQNRDTQLALYKTNAAKRLEIEQGLGQDVLAAQKRVLEAQRDQAIRSAHEQADVQRAALTTQYGKGKEPTGLLGKISDTETRLVDAANATFQTENSKLYLAQTERLNTAQAALTAETQRAAEKVRTLRGEYSSLAQGMRDKIAAGRVETADLTEYTRKLSEVDKKAADLGLTQHDLIVGTRANAQAIYQLGIDAQLAAGYFDQFKTGLDFRAAVAQIPPAEKTFAALQSRIQDFRRDLADPVVVEAWTQQVQAFGAAGRLTGEQVRALLADIQTLAAAPDLAWMQDFQDAQDVGNRRFGDGTAAMDNAMRQSYGVGAQGLDAALKGYGAQTIDELDTINRSAADSMRRVYKDVLDQMVADAEAAGQEMADAVAVSDKRYGDGTGATDAALRQSFGLGRDGFAAALKNYGVTSLEELDQVNRPIADAIRRVYKSVLDQMEQDMVDARARGETILENFRLEAERIADQTAGDADSALLDKNDQDSALVKRTATLGPGMLLNFLGGAGNDFFGDKFWTRLGDQGREEFLAALNDVTPEQLALLPVEFLAAFNEKIGDQSEWQGLKAKITQGITLATDVFDGVLKGFDDTGKAIFYTDEELRNLDPTLQKTTGDFYDLENVLRNVGRFSESELEKLIIASGLGADEAKKLRDAWHDVNDELRKAELDGRQGAVGSPTLFNAGERLQLSRDREQFEKELAQQRFDDEVKTLSAGSPAYKLAQQRLENARTQAAQKGAEERTAIIVSEAEAIAGYVTQLGGIFDRFTGQSKGAVSILGDWMGMNVKAFAQWKKGDVVGAVLTTVEGILNLGDSIRALDPVYAKWKQNTLDLAAAAQQAMGSKTIGGTAGLNSWVNPYYDALKKNADALSAKANASVWQEVAWALFGGAPEAMSEEASKQLATAGAIFNDFATSLYSGLENELMTAIDENDFSKASINMGKLLDRFVRRMFVQALIAKSRLGDLAKQLADEVAAGQDTTSTRAQIQAETDAVINQAEAGAPSLPGAGAGKDSSTDAPANSPAGDPVVGSTFYVANSSKIDLFDNVIARADAMYLRHEGVLTLHSAAMTAHAAALDRSTAMYDRLLRDGVALRDSQGGLAAVLR
ncbi:phage tail tape measure protein [Deinococcus yunweiensis]|uniref:phage tail tape measure protein n=1 Tax=Deinococcus yunweiensis TaxID=367282 RepID=UPI00398F794C